MNVKRGYIIHFSSKEHHNCLFAYVLVLLMTILLD